MRRRPVAYWIALATSLAACRVAHVDPVEATPAHVDAAAPKSITAAPKSITAAAAAIAGGKPLWVDSNLDPQDALINARVDIGTLKQIGNELEATTRWPIGPGQRRDLQLSHPELRLPDGAVEQDRERLRCGRDRLQSFAIETSFIAPDGSVLRHQSFDVAKARQEEVARDAAMAKSNFPFGKYGSSPRDLVCWAAARKCEHQAFTWPPPPNDVRFDDPHYAERRDAYDAQFIPSCTLS